MKEGQEKISFEPYNGTYGICENEKKSVPILIVNNEAADDSYKLDVTGIGWAKLNANEFSLPRKQSGAVLLQLSPDKKQQASRGKGRFHTKAFG